MDAIIDKLAALNALHQSHVRPIPAFDAATSSLTPQYAFSQLLRGETPALSSQSVSALGYSRRLSCDLVGLRSRELSREEIFC